MLPEPLYSPQQYKFLVSEMWFVYETLLWSVKIFWCNKLVDDWNIPHQLSLCVKLYLEKLSVYSQLKRMCYMLLELETLLVVYKEQNWK